MRADNGKRISERRSSDRLMDDSILLVSGYNAVGLPFSEITKISDVSLSGISFQLRTAIEIDAILDVSICSAKQKDTSLSPMFQVKARVLRVSKAKASDESSLIAAHFQGEFLELLPCSEHEDVARKLKTAIESDERSRDEYEL